jgi:hypothetical protein
MENIEMRVRVTYSKQIPLRLILYSRSSKDLGKDHAGVLEFPLYSHGFHPQARDFNSISSPTWVFVEEEKSSIFGLNRSRKTLPRKLH